ncbi:MAG: hypothetical protein DMG43_03610 [Acidobacteria bacterium]|nr:MAG: hypothetical protein DMG43_03610 [Acidobacteriota bacterium]
MPCAKAAAGSGYHGEMIPIRCRGLLFDLDGVLVDSTPAVARVWAVWAREHGFEPDEVVRKGHGRPSMATIRELLPSADHEAENREAERRVAREGGCSRTANSASKMITGRAKTIWRSKCCRSV